MNNDNENKDNKTLRNWIIYQFWNDVILCYFENPREEDIENMIEGMKEQLAKGKKVIMSF